MKRQRETKKENKGAELKNKQINQKKPHKTHNVTGLTVALFVQCIERLASELGMAGDTRETFHVEYLLHSNAATPITKHVVSTPGTPA